MDITVFYLIGGLTLLISLGVRQRLKSAYRRWGQVRSATGKPGGQVARLILDANGLDSVPVEPVPGLLSDHYDPRRKLVRLSQENFAGNSVAATAVAAHECGHALQDADGYGPLAFRNATIPLINLAARFGLPLAIFGGLFGSTRMVQFGILGYVGAIVLTFLVLPVEFNASKRALRELERLDLISETGSEGVRKVLGAAAMTYVAGVASSAGFLIYLVISGGRVLLGKPPLPPPPR